MEDIRRPRTIHAAFRRLIALLRGFGAPTFGMRCFIGGGTSAARLSKSDAGGVWDFAPSTTAMERDKTRGTGPDGSRFPEALVVAINQACGARKWYTKTGELQLASLQLCEACRNAHTVHLRVYGRTPTSLIAAGDAFHLNPAQGVSSRVPRVRARCVTWELPSLVPLSNLIHTFAEVEELYLGDAFRCTLEVESWPSRLRVIQFSVFSRFNQPIDGILWPGSLRHLTFGHAFNKPIEAVTWPSSILQLTFGGAFNKPIGTVTWPRSLQELKFGRDFDQPINGVEWPASLIQLMFCGRFNQPIQGDLFPSSLLRLSFGPLFNQHLQGVTWPASLQELTFGSDFDQPIDHVQWPRALLQLAFGFEFNQPIHGDLLPRSLVKLQLSLRFNQPIDGVVWPLSLQQLTFGYSFDQPIQETTWPARLRKLTFDGDFNRPIDGIVWPPLLQEVAFGMHFDQPIEGAVWPSSMRGFLLMGKFSKSLRKLGTIMPSLQRFTLLYWFDPAKYAILRGIEWPVGLTHLTVRTNACLEGVVIPASVSLSCIEVDVLAW